MLESRPIGTAKQVRLRLGGEDRPLAESTLWRLLKTDQSFPRPFQVGGHRRWFLDEIETWVATRPRRQYVVGEPAE